MPAETAPNKFTDEQGREWLLEISVFTIGKVRKDTGLDLMKLLTTDLCNGLSRDPCQMVAVLYSIVEAEAEHRNVSPEDFGRGLKGDAIDKAYRALLEGLLPYVRPAQRAALRKAFDTLLESETALIEATEQAFGEVGSPRENVAALKDQLVGKLRSAFAGQADAFANALAENNRAAAAVGSAIETTSRQAAADAAAVGASMTNADRAVSREAARTVEEVARVG